MVKCDETDEANQEVPGLGLATATCGGAVLPGAGVLDAATLPDYFRYDTIDPDCVTPVARVRVTSGGPITVCVREDCPGAAGIGDGQCQAGENNANDWCCGIDEAAVSVECGQNDAASIDVEFGAADPQCLAFDFEYSF